METKSFSNTKDREVVITRLFDAPRELVFKVWTDPEHLKKWFAPHGCSIEYLEIDVTAGGRFHSCIKNPKYPDCWCIGTYLEVIVPERIVYTIALCDENGNRVKSSEAEKDPEWPEETVVTVTFKNIKGKTEVTLHQTVAESLARKTGAYSSWFEMLDRLEVELTKEYESYKR